jgi:3-hydroxy-9,10-secoandrosta-1,3,5(10)-triene-9,17-dione monooxygenase
MADTLARSQQQTADDGIPGRDELIRLASDMVPMLRERAAKAEADRRMPDETQQAFVDAGLYRIFIPKRWGGYEMDFTTIIDISAELGRGCGSSAWVFTNVAQHGLINGMKGAKCQEELWADNPDSLCASSHPGPDAEIKRLPDGFEVSGTWHFSSGIDFADWVNIQLFLRPDDAPWEHRFALVPKSDYEIIDDWFMTGMSATGSRSMKIEKAFIPDYRTISTTQITGGPTPGTEVSDNLLYQLPFWGIASRLFSGPAIGLARGAQEILEDDLDTRISKAGIALKEESLVHLRLAESGAETNAGWALALADCHTARRMIEAGERPGLLQRVNWRRNNAYAVEMCQRAVDRLYGLSGMRGMEIDSHIQRAWRDVHAAASQVGITWDANATIYGRARFGMPIRDPRA